MKWKCKICGETRLDKMSCRTICHRCHYNIYKSQKREYSKNYMATRRWLDGGPDKYLMMPKGYIPDGNSM